MSETSSLFTRRTFLGVTGTTIVMPLINMPSLSAFAQTNPKKILWAGIHILQSCVSAENCDIEREFPRIQPILESEKYLPKINMACRGEWGTKLGKNADLQLTWHRPENNYLIDANVKLGAFVGIAADTVLGAAYAQSLDKTLTLYGIQTYLIIFDVDKFEILQSFPMRIMSARDDPGDTGINNEKIASEMLNHLGYQPPQKGQESIWLPNLIRNNLNKVSLGTVKPVNLRVTDVTITDFTKKWLDKQNKSQNLYQGFLGHSLTQSISEVFKIGIQPHSPSKATYEITQSFVAGGRNTQLFQKNLNTAPIDLELRIRVRGIVSKEKALERYNNAVKKKSLLIMFSVECGRWSRIYAPSDRQKLIPLKIIPKENIFKQEIKILLEELRTDEFGNDWQMVLDLQQRALDWFITGIFQEDYQNLATGLTQRGEQRFINLRINTKEVDNFIAQAKDLRRAFLSL